jgi:hypothetical protein
MRKPPNEIASLKAKMTLLVCSASVALLLHNFHCMFRF